MPTVHADSTFTRARRALCGGVDAAAIAGEKHRSDRFVTFSVESPALRRAVDVQVLLPKDNSAPGPPSTRCRVWT